MGIKGVTNGEESGGFTPAGLERTDPPLPRNEPNPNMVGRIALTVVSAEYPRTGWWDYANCYGADPDLFFPQGGAASKKAQAFCDGCIVKIDCLEYALQINEKDGIWGGTSARERKRIRRQRAQTARSIVGA